MPLIGRVGRRHVRVRALIGVIYALLIAGGVTMVYPFLLMVSGSTKTAVDAKENRLVPSFLVDDAALYRKHVEALFNEQLEVMRAGYDLDVATFEQIAPPAAMPHEAELDAWGAFLSADMLSDTAWTIGYVHAPVSRAMPRLLRAFKRYLEHMYGWDIAAVNRALDTEFTGWNAVYVIPEDWTSRRQPLEMSPLQQAFADFKRTQPWVMRTVFNLEGAFRRQFLVPQYGRDIDAYNRTHDTAYAGYGEVPFPERYPAGASLAVRNDWERFVRDGLNLTWIRFDPGAADRFRDFLAAKYRTLDALNRKYRTAYTSWREVPMPESAPVGGLALTDWEAFLVGWEDPDSGTLIRAAPQHLRVVGPESLYRDFLRGRFPDLAGLNAAWGTAYGSWEAIPPPHQGWQYREFQAHRTELRRAFAGSNYAAVWDFLATHGRGFRNTVIYCALAVLAALVVNPMAAYALSRFKLKRTYTLLLIMLLTMAFPPMVTQIPVFLMMRDFHLLNTFAALILPGLAHGYSIFLLKGFFDSLPRELYESASIDGAGEWTMFRHITMSLSKPILAVIALQAFNLAYSNFMYALLICQDEKMWTLMVWLYQLQMRSGPGVMYASLILAALPMLVIFVFCQNIIMRGIVVPVEK